MKGYVLRTTCDRLYVGITRNLARRFREHRAAGPLRVYEHMAVRTCEFASQERAARWERLAIRILGKNHDLLNTSKGGYGGRSVARSEVEKAFASDRLKSRLHDPVFRAEFYARSALARQSEAFQEKWPLLCAEICAKPEVREARSKAQKQAWKNPETRANRLAGLRASRNDPARKEQRSEAAKKMWKKRRREAGLL